MACLYKILFILVKLFNKLERHKEEKTEEPKKSEEVILLSEIRDLLKKK